jgi:Right handed beta helix region
MKTARFTLNVLAVVIVTLAVSSFAQAQASRTWVSGVGDDANPCSRTAPCKTFAGAISKTAAGGEIDVLDPGGFGAVTITKSITIDGTGTFASILVSGTNAIIINAGTSDVVSIRGISFNGFGTGLNGVRVLAAGKVFVEDCEIFNFKGAGGRGITDERTTGGKLFITNTTIRDNGQSAVVVLPGSGATTIQAELDNVRMIGNGNAGISASNGSRVVVRNSVASGNTNFGFFAEGPAGAAELNLESCVSSANGQGVTAAGGGTIRMSNVHVTNNGTGLSSTGGTFATYGNNRISGNGAGNAVPGAPAPIPGQ